MAGITLEQAQAQLNAWLAASLAVSQGQSFEIAGWRLVRADAAEVMRSVQYWQQQVSLLARAASGRGRSRTVLLGG